MFLFKRVRERAPSTLSIRRRLLPPSYAMSFETHLTTTASQLSEFARLLYETVVSPLSSGSTITNIQGTGPNNSLFSAAGLVASDEQISFSGFVRTPFLDFPSRNQIRFSVLRLCERSDEIDTSWEALLGQIASLHSLNLDLSLFHTTLLSRLSTFGPVVGERVSIIASKDLLSLSISSDVLSKRDEYPLQTNEIWDKLSLVFRHCYRYNLPSDYSYLTGVMI
jgi:hypothetical protein